MPSYTWVIFSILFSRLGILKPSWSSQLYFVFHLLPSLCPRVPFAQDHWEDDGKDQTGGSQGVSSPSETSVSREQAGELKLCFEANGSNFRSLTKENLNFYSHEVCCSLMENSSPQNSRLLQSVAFPS